MGASDDKTGPVSGALFEAALDRAVDGNLAALLDLLERNSKLPGPRANLELARVLGASIARRRGRADALVRTLVTSDDAFGRIVGAMALMDRSLAGIDERGALAALLALAEDPRHPVRDGVVWAVRHRIEARGDAAVDDLAAWTQGYYPAALALEALADCNLLARLGDGSAERVLARLDEAFALFDGASRADTRAPGLRALGTTLPIVVARVAGRFPAVVAWVDGKTATRRPESREVVANVIAALRGASLKHAEASRLSAALERSAPPPRDPSRIVSGTRRRGRSR